MPACASMKKIDPQEGHSMGALTALVAA